jgi:hypothetical protein
MKAALHFYLKMHIVDIFAELIFVKIASSWVVEISPTSWIPDRTIAETRQAWLKTN